MTEPSGPDCPGREERPPGRNEPDPAADSGGAGGRGDAGPTVDSGGGDAREESGPVVDAGGGDDAGPAVDSGGGDARDESGPAASTGGAREESGPAADSGGREDTGPETDSADGGAREESRPPVDDPLVFPPTLREVMLRPRWVAMLGLCLVVAGVFAWLGQWQLASAIDTDPQPEGQTEQVRPLEDVVEPGQYLNEPLVGQRVDVRGTFVPDDFIVVSSRFNDDVEGYWVTGQLRVARTAESTSIAVAVGWVPTREQADAAAASLREAAQEALSGTADPATALREGLVELTGRIVSDEGPVPPPPGAHPLEQTRMSPAALLSRWHDPDGGEVSGLQMYRPYLASDDPAVGLGVKDLDAISSPAPAASNSVNWLNIFYAAEWAIFAGFAFYIWYRLTRDAWERELEALSGTDPDES